MTVIQADIGLTYRLAEDGEGWQLLCLPNPSCEINPATGRIVSVAYDEMTETAPPESECIRVLTPGFINGHAHLELNPAQPVGLAQGDTMADWLVNVASRYRDRVHSDRIEDATQAAQELLATGCTAVNDVSTAGASLDALCQTGLRGRVGVEFFHPGSTLDETRIQAIVQTVNTLGPRVLACPWVDLGLSPHSPYNVSPEALEAVLLEWPELPVQMHISESADEWAWFQVETAAIDAIHKRFLGQTFRPPENAKTPFESVLPALRKTSEKQPWVLVHGNYLQPSELEIMAALGAGLVHCPVSNAFLGHPPLNLQAVDAAGVAWCFGTDGRVSNPQLDLRAEARASLEQGITAEDAFFALTAGAAEALAWEALGELSPGAYADIVVWRVPNHPNSDLIEMLLSLETRVDAVWVAGQQRV